MESIFGYPDCFVTVRNYFYGMSHFPVTHSNLSAAHLAVYLKDHYAITGGVDCRILKSGINDTYLLTDSTERWIFRVYSLHWRSAAEILEEVRLLDRLREQKVPVSYAIRDAKGNYLQEFDAPEGKRYGVMFSFAAGEKVQNYSAEVHYNIGMIMARMHEVTRDLTLERVYYNTDTLVTEPLEQLSQFLPEHAEEMKFMRGMGAYLGDAFAKVKTDEVRRGAVHADMWFDNMGIDKDGGGVTLFDFDFCGNGWLCLDVAYYILQLHNTEREEAVGGEKLRSFLAGYESVTELSSEERRIMPMLGLSMYFFYLGVQSRRYENWSNSFFNEVYVRRYIQAMVRRYADIYGLNYLVKPFAAGDIETYRTMRLEALEKHHGIYGNSHAFEAAFTDEQWLARLSNPDAVCLGLYSGEELIGITSIIINADNRDEAYMTQSYIRATHRGKGLSTLLYEARLRWARERGLKRLVVGHKASNLVSKAANQRAGFRFTHGEMRDWPDGTTEEMCYYEFIL